MRVNELQIGDWVFLEFANKRLSLGDIISISRGVKARPIPLTAEILEKNGFVVEQVGEEFSIYYCKDGEIVFGFDYDVKSKEYWVNFGYFSNVVFHHVHELQRALRCCGLWDLADNFVI